MDNITMLNEVLAAVKEGYYNGKYYHTALKLNDTEIRHSKVYLPADVDKLKKFNGMHYMGGTRLKTICENTDSFTLARKMAENCERKVLVLNLANPVNPGGGVRRGARAQEEDLCRKSTLLVSLEDKSAKKYYKYNSELQTYMGSDAVIITPQVEILKDEKGDWLENSVVVSVMTCAAPMVTYGLEGMSQQQYEDMVYKRIQGMLKVAATEGYKNLVLGAFGCGAFGNDAHLVSDLFFKALKETDFGGYRTEELFDTVGFAVLDRTANKYNFNEFNRNFGEGKYYAAEDQQIADEYKEETLKTEVNLDAIRGCMVGGAAGDALGYPVEFMSYSQITNRYGKSGITEYTLTGGKALVSDDTQMTLFTANGINFAKTRIAMRGIGGQPSMYMSDFYIDWLETQEKSSPSRKKDSRGFLRRETSWLLDVPELYSQRAPGNTCLDSLEELRKTKDREGSYVDWKRNNSKGCGAIMRVAPLALAYEHAPIEVIDREAAEISAITHCHSLGYIPSSVLVHIINKAVFSRGSDSLKDIVLEAKKTVNELFKKDKHINEMNELIDRAIMLAEKCYTDSDEENIRKIGEGWVAEETLAIAIYCALRYQNDFSKGIIAAVNHNGDSDSTGAVTGNILGAWLGYSAIEDKWKENLELLDVILEMSDDLCHGCRMSEFGRYRDDEWVSKYIYARRYTDNSSMKEPETEEIGMIGFYLADEDYGCFSNWYSSDFEYAGKKYCSVEQYMMYQKVSMFHQYDLADQIMETSDPAKIKKLGRILMSVRDEFKEELSLFDGDIIKINARNMDPIPEWKTKVSVLMSNPKYHNAVKAYVDTLGGFERDAALNGTFEDIDGAMKYNIGGGLPIQGFYEMKQEVYEIAAKDAQTRKW